MLYFAEYSNGLGKFLEGLDEASTALGEGLPVNVRILTSDGENLLKVGLDIFYLDVTHTYYLSQFKNNLDLILPYSPSFYSLNSYFC